VLGSLIKASRRSGREPREAKNLLASLSGRATFDPAPEVRVEAIRALAALGGAEAASLLREIGLKDADQRVRYQAQVSLMDLKATGH
jgi:HEAT repeat protein